MTLEQNFLLRSILTALGEDAVDTADVPAMKGRRILSLILVFFLVISAGRLAS